MTQSAPSQVQKMCGFMTEMLEVCEELADDYQPNHQKTKDILKELEEVKAELLSEMTELKYTLH
ncbi:MAG: hypothetical protein JW734_04005 [Candidatus Omnitrophica bacterium]|nr:hypothetical protein [Candidatus Omnitrophota bacterium]